MSATRTRTLSACSREEHPASTSEDFFQTHPVFTHEEYARSRQGGSSRTVDSLLRKHVQSGRIARVRRGLYVTVPRGGLAEAVDPYLIATKAADDAAIRIGTTSVDRRGASRDGGRHRDDAHGAGVQL